MKKLFTFILVLATMSSCLKKEPDKFEGIYPGMEIYSVVSGHNYYSNIALVKAFDFNMLLSEYDPQEHTSFDKVVVKVDGTDVAVKKRLFDTSVDSPKVEAVEGSAGVYQIKYGGDALSWTKVDGIIEIDTKEKTLDELAAGEFWSIAIKGNNEDNFMIPRSNGSWVMISPNQQMSITKTSEGKKWNASVMGYSFKFYVTEDNQSESADWSGNYTVVLDKGENLSFSGCWTGTVAVEGTGGGTTTGKIEMECTTKTPLLFYPYCSRESHRAGEVEYGFSNPLDASRAGYPSATVDMKFVKGDGCSFSVYIKYNGKEAQWQ